MIWTATQALNGILGAGVPQDWATHILGHQLTAFHGLDHAQTIAIILPNLLQEKREEKRDKLLQYAERVWNFTEHSEEERISKAIHATRQFFESLGVKTRLSDYQLDGSSIPAMIKKLEQQGLVAIGEHQSITLDISKRIYEASI
ncbi:iron-containing alcohol dehydrogenase [Xenorhabdus sp. Reich]|uniref:Iron-containing alcohol dehydrogenase n=1 Tax=Xenorhabdus littoralis TaxID=2582835 RepID=A0ABU4SK50_9GAMM|nr:iron-containing alcohol dehydrogenase [Xenorhabdus sp. Reich]